MKDVPKGHVVPPLLAAFAEWLATQEHGALGYFDALACEEVPPTWHESAATRLQKAAFVFLSLGDGSLLALMDTGRPSAPYAVVLLGSEGDAATVATSLEAFLHLLAAGDTGVSDLDDEDARGRKRLAMWLKAKKVKAPKASDFDFRAWLDGDADATAPPATSARAESEAAKALPPRLRRLAGLLGRRADDPDVVAYMSEIGAKAPTSATDSGSLKEAKATKLGVTVYFDHDILNEAFPLLPKTKNAFMPYVSSIELGAKWSEPLPFGLRFGDDANAIERALGAPHLRPMFADEDEPLVASWTRDIDPGISELLIETSDGKLTASMQVVRTVELTSRHGLPPACAVGLLVAWLVQRGLLDEARIPGHRALVAKVRAREAKGSELAKAAFPRGLWEEHVRADEKTRRRLHQWLHSMADLSFDDDLIGVFGEREDEHGHTNAALDDDTWQAFDAIVPIFDTRFPP